MATAVEQQQDQVWLSKPQAARYLGVTERTVRNYIARGELSAARIQGSHLIRIRRSDLDALLRPIPSAGGGRVA